MRSRIVVAVCALALAGCGDIHETQTVSYAGPSRPPAVSAWSPGLGPPLAWAKAVDDRARWAAAETWNRQVTIQAAEARWNAARAATRPPAAPKPRQAPVQPPNPPGVTTGVSCGGWQELVASLWPADQVRTACRILMCESGGDPNAYNPSGAIGLMQLLGHGGTFDPWQNLTVAYRLWLSQGWRPWVCR